jgi:hypothetical protein
MDPESMDPESTSPYSSNVELAVRDYQLNEALTLLKGLHIISRMKTPQG